jgi:predicted Zn-dependent protease
MPWLRRAVAAAAIVLVVSLAWVFFLRPASPKVLAQEYIRKELTRVGVTMGKDQDALTQARTLYNAGDLAGAASFLDSLLQKEPDDAEANKFSGIVSLRQGNHDKALGRFSRLAALPGLYANPGLFLEAVTLMDRDGVGDKAKAKEVLEQVVRDGLGGHEQSRDWLKKF